MNERIASQQPVDQASGIEIRRLSYPDLPQVIAIERRVFPTPWSLAMFVLELSKQSGICLAASVGDEDGGRRLVGYLICSRYDTVWHVMNVAVDHAYQRRGLASAMLADLYERVGDPRARFTLEVRRSNARRDPPLRARGLPRGRHAPALLPGQRRGRARHVAHAGDARRLARRRAQPRSVRPYDDPRAGDELRRHVRGGRSTRDGRMRSNVISSQEAHARFGGVVPEIASRHHLELVNVVVEQALRARRRDARRRRARRRHAGPRARRGAAGRPLHGKGARRRPRAAVRARRPPPGARRRELPARAGPAVLRSSRRSCA